MKLTHECPGGCGARLPRHRYACRACWYRLPAELRRPINATWGVDWRAHLEAMVDAELWYDEHPLARQDQVALGVGEDPDDV